MTSETNSDQMHGAAGREGMAQQTGTESGTLCRGFVKSARPRQRQVAGAAQRHVLHKLGSITT